ncbi:MAG TPA: type I polyketide synthase [Leptolyngbyaceae cyanobacterium]
MSADKYLYSGAKFLTLVELLRYRALHQPHQTAYVFLQDGEVEAGRLTYQELDTQARAIAAYLQSKNAQGQRALLLYPPGLEFISAFFGCLYSGVIAVPAYPPRRNQKMSRLQSIISDSQSSIALTTNSMLADIQNRLNEEQQSAAMHLLATDDIANDLATNWQQPEINSNTLAFLQYTSGSTSNPKGVMVSHGNLLYTLADLHVGWQHTPESVMVSWLPTFHDLGLIYGVLEPLNFGFPCYLMPPASFLQKPLRWLEAISRYGGTHSAAPNFAYDLCASKITEEQKANLDLSTWQMALNAAEPISCATIDKFIKAFAVCGFRTDTLCPGYGLAETTLKVSTVHCDQPTVLFHVSSTDFEQHRVVTVPPDAENCQTWVGCGEVALDTKVVIADPERLTRCAPDEVGEIWVAGACVAQGYWNHPQATKETFQAYTADTGEGPFLRTGDLGFLIDGQLCVTGRIKDLIIIGGKNHYPQDIERTVEACHPALKPNCGAAFSVTVGSEERLVVAQEVERSHLRKLNQTQVMSAIRQAVSEQHELQVYAIVLLKTASIPKTSSGKIQRRACQSGFLANTLDVVASWQESSPQSQTNNSESNKVTTQPKNYQKLQAVEEIKKWLIANIAARLGSSTQDIDIHKPLVEYGLSSMVAVGISGELQEWLKRPLSPTLLYDYSTIESLALYLGGVEVTNSQPKTHQLTTDQEAIAIVGMSCRVPGANNLDEFWQLLQNKVDAIAQVPPSRWQSNFSDPKVPAWGGFIADVDQFDPQFFGIAPREAESMDPQQRLLLEVTWEALENAGQAPDQLAGTDTGVFIGISNYDYGRLQFQQSTPANAYAGTGNALSIAANRLSYLLDLRGPSWAVDTACSSSLVAVNQACLSLQKGECQIAIAGGVNLILSPEMTVTFAQAGMLSPDGRCKTFDTDANGYVRGEGCGVVILKRLTDAYKDGDTILALIKGTAVNQDGRSNGLTAPNGLAQQAVIRQALAKAGIAPADIDYVEAHGTGTSLGDPIEVNALKEVLMTSRQPNQLAYIGSVKTNIGHLEAAAGIAGLIKVVLALQHQAIPANLHLQKLNPLINLDGTPITIPTELQPWTVGEKRRLAGISSFGFGGTNAHLIVEEATPVPPAQTDIERPRHLFTLSAKTPSALKQLAQRYQSWLNQNSPISLANLCFTTNTGRTHFHHRLAIIAQSEQELQSELTAFVSGKDPSIDSQIAPKRPKIAFLFSGQGSQYVNMGRQLSETNSTFRQILQHCEEIVKPYLQQPLLSVLYPDTGVDSPLNITAYTQPAIFAIEYALYELWKSWGIQPDIVMGHSLGEYAAACAAGIITWEEGLILVTQRAKLMQTLPNDGAMVAVFAEETQIRAALATQAGEVVIAAVNGKQNIVLSGSKAKVESVVATLTQQGIKTKFLNVSQGFHSPLMEPMLAEFTPILEKVTFVAPEIDIVANLTGNLATADITTPAYWCRQILEPVQFAPGMETLRQQGCSLFIEIGANPTLVGMGIRCLPEITHGWLPSLRQGQEDWQSLLTSLKTLYLQGISIDWLGFDRDYPRQKLSQLPTYPFERSRYWLETAKNLVPVASSLTDAQQIPILDLLSQGDTEKLAQLLTDKSTSPMDVLENLVKVYQWQLRLSPVQDLLYQIQWQLKPNNLAITSVKSENWLIFADKQGFGDQITKQLKEQGHRCHLVYANDTYQQINDQVSYINPYDDGDYKCLLQDVLTVVNFPITKILYLWGLEAEFTSLITPSAIQQIQQYICGSALFLVQALAKYGQTISPHLWIVTKGAIAFNQELPNIVQAPLQGLGKVIALEHHQLWGGMVDLSADATNDEVETLLQAIATANGEDQIAIRQGLSYVPRLVAYQSHKGLLQQPHPTSTYLITGGLGALGLQIAQNFVQHGARHLVLISRSPASQSAQIILDDLKQQGVIVKVIQADVASAPEIAAVLEDIQANMPPLRGIIHAAGVLDDGVLVQQNWQRFSGVMTPKVAGAWNLHQLTQDLPLDFFVCFSSTSALLGSPGQGNYVAANAFIDALAQYRQGLGLPGLSINWGPWSGIGMAASVDNYYQARWRDQGISPLHPEQALSILQLLLHQDKPQVGVMQVDWSIFSQHYGVEAQRPILQELITQTKPQTGEIETVCVTPDLLTELNLANVGDRYEILVTYLQKQVHQILKLPSSQLPDPQQGFFDMGIDSLMTVELKNLLESHLHISLPTTLVLEFPTIHELAVYLEQEVALSPSTKNTPNTPQTDFAPTDLEELANPEILSEITLVDSTLVQELAELETLLEGRN